MCLWTKPPEERKSEGGSQDEIEKHRNLVGFVLPWSFREADIIFDSSLMRLVLQKVFMQGSTQYFSEVGVLWVNNKWLKEAFSITD